MKAKFVISQLVFIGIVNSIIISSGLSQTNWFWQNPLPQGGNIKKIQFTDYNTGYAVGDFFATLKTTNAGENWFSLYINQDSIPIGLNGNFSSLFFLNSNTGYIGRNGIFKTTDGGDYWTYQNTQYAVNSIFFTTVDTGYASCDDGFIIKTINGGANWVLQFSIGDITIDFHKIYFTSKNTGFVTGSVGTILKTTNQGTSWINKFQPSGMILLDLFFLNNLTGVASSSTGKLLKTVNGGENWNYINSSEIGYANINSVNFKNIDTGYLVSNFYGPPEGLVYKTINGGNNWTLINNFGYYINEINFNSRSEAFLSCDGGNILKSSNSGLTWENKIYNTGISNLQSIEFIDENTGFIAGTNNAFFKTTNGGINWDQQVIPALQDFKYVKFFDSGTGYLAGQNLFKTTNSGFSWDSIADLDSLMKISFENMNTGYYLRNNFLYKTTSGGINWTNQFTVDKAVNFCFLKNSDTGFVFNNYRIGPFNFPNYVSEMYRTTNSGLNWTMIYSYVNPYFGYLNYIVFTNSNTGYITGNPGVFKTTNGGNNWINIENTYGCSSQIYFYNDNVGYISNYTKVLKTTNFGNNWTKVYESSKNFNSYFFTGLNTGYVVGQYGYILKTTNGGGIFVNVNENNNGVVMDYVLCQNYPNPFNPNTKIEFELPKNENVKLIIYDLLGREVNTLVNDYFSAGKHEAVFDGLNLSSGIYFYKLETENFSQTKRMILLK